MDDISRILPRTPGKRDSIAKFLAAGFPVETVIDVGVQYGTPELIDTPMAIEGHSKASGIDKEALRKGRDRAVPIGHMGRAEDVAFAALYLMSDEAKFVTGVILPVDGGSSVKVAI